MGTKLFNVRLNENDASMLAALRKRGVNLSELVRAAIRGEYAHARESKRRPRDVRELLQNLSREFPVSENDYPAPLDLTDRRAVQQRIYEHLASRDLSNGPHRHQRPRRSA